MDVDQDIMRSPQMGYRLDPDLGFHLAEPFDPDKLSPEEQAKYDADLAEAQDWLRKHGDIPSGDQ